MSRLLSHPALWPWLALNPEPFGAAADPDSPERLFQTWHGPQAEPDRVATVATRPGPRVRVVVRRYRLPASRLHQFPRRR